MPQPMLPQGVNPELLARQAQGEAAKMQLQGLNSGPLLADALRRSQTQMPGMTGQGYSASAPTIFNAIGTMLDRGAGKKDVGNIRDQAAALRGEVMQGRTAGLEAEQEAARADYQYRHGLEEARTQRETEAARRAQELAANKRGLKTYISPSGEERTVQTGPDGQGYLDGQPIENFSEWTEKERARSGSGFGSGLKPSSSERSSYLESVRLQSVMDGLDDAWTGLTPEGQEQLDQPITEAAISVLPNSLQRLAEERVFSNPDVQRYRTRVARLESKLSQLASGLAVTGYEMKDRQKWSPNAPGISQEERQRRIENVQRDIEEGRNVYERMYPDYTIPPDEGQGRRGSEDAEIDAQIAAVQAEIDRMRAAEDQPNGQR